MGMSASGIICYGIQFDEGYEFPWDDEEFGGDIEDWWRVQANWNPPKELYDDHGVRLPGVTQADVDAHFKARSEFDAEHPCPIKDVNYGTCDYAMYILAVPSTVKRCDGGEPEELDPSKLTVTIAQRQALLHFCEEYHIEMSEPQWYLASYWG